MFREKSPSWDLIGFGKPPTPLETIIFLKERSLEAFGRT